MPNRNTKSLNVDVSVFSKGQRAAAIAGMPFTKWANMILDQTSDKIIAEGRLEDRVDNTRSGINRNFNVLDKPENNPGVL